MGFGKSDFVFSLEGYIKILLLVFGSVLYILTAVNLSSFNQNFRASFSSWNVDLPFELRLNAIQGPSDLSKLQSLQQQKPLYEMGYRAWEGVFMGVKAGCYCASGDFYHEMDPGFFEKPCNSSQLNVGCRDSRPIPETKLKYWDSNEIISIGGIKGANFIKLSQNMNSDGSGKSGMRKCSANHPVSKGLCVPAEWNACPITDLKVGSGDQSFNTSIKLDEIYVDK